MRIISYILSTILVVAAFAEVCAHRPPDRNLKNSKPTTGSTQIEFRGGACNPSESETELNINNVRARLLGGGDMWWDLDDGRYEIPKVEPNSGQESVSSIFAGSVWIGGYDQAGALKIAAIDYRAANSNEWWPGPIDESTGATCEEDCNNWDRHFEVTSEDIFLHKANYQRSIEDPNFNYDVDKIPPNIRYWPATGNPYFVERYGFPLPNTQAGLGNFFETEGNENGQYEPQLGEHPQIDVKDCPPGIFADQMFFWVYNDVGNIHTNTNGDPIRMEVQVQGFSYSTTDEINDMTFYRYKLINRANQRIDSCFFAMWVDPDLGCYTDDYIGCDIDRSLMYIYNVDEQDGTTGCDCNGGVPTYCTNVPILGVDYFRGPEIPKVIDPITGEIRNPRLDEMFVDTTVEGGMSSFTYYNNQAFGNPNPATVDPTVGLEFYNYLSGSWRDGTRLTVGGDGYNIGSTDYTDYALSDPPNQSGGWSMCEESLPNGDRRTIQATGPLRLDPSATNELIIGVVWVPDQQYPCPDLAELYGADDKAQDLFDACFELIRGPDAPDMNIIELDRELILVLTNEPAPLRNNENESYKEKGLGFPDNVVDSNYLFEGYRIFQVAGPEVTRQELNDDSKAREIATFDVKNGVDEIYNWESVIDPGPSGQQVYFPVLQVAGDDGGVRHTLRVTQDRFSNTTDTRLVNHKKYYFYVIAYGYNNFEQFDVNAPASTQGEAYLEGRINVGDSKNGSQAYIGTPRPMVYLDVNSRYGQGADITRHDGIGVGGNFLEISKETEAKILDGTFDGEITYKPGGGPIDISIFNPLEAKSGNYEIKFYDENMGNNELDDTIRWQLTNDQGDVVNGDKPLGAFNEQLIKEFGFSVNIGQTKDAGDITGDNDGFIGLEIEYEDQEKPFWFNAVGEGSVLSFGGGSFPWYDFIRNDLGQRAYDLDPNKTFSSNFMFPYILAEHTIATEVVSPAWDNNFNGIVINRVKDLQGLNNVDVVFTSDKSKWSRCIVVEASNAAAIQASFPSIGNAEDFELRQSPSVGKEDADGDGLADEDGSGTMGMSWFPGYAIDVETGERLNIFFAENSSYSQTMVDQANVEFDDDKLIATDMMWNPSSQQLLPQLLANSLTPLAAFTGGQHFVYVTRQKYDECEQLREAITGPRPLDVARGLENITWSFIPILQSQTNLLSYDEGLIPNDMRIKVRVDNPYQWEVGTDEHGGYNFYSFKYEGVEAVEVTGKDNIDDALDAVNVVPNPYYGFSEYEVSRFDNAVKITNLPFRSTITIYSIDGRFIRQFKRDVMGGNTLGKANSAITGTLPNPDLVWDLKNGKNIPVSSGTYIIHVKDEDTGAETSIKWFGVARKFDPTGL